MNKIKIRESAQIALNIILSEAEARNYNPPANTDVVAELEFIISNCK